MLLTILLGTFFCLQPASVVVMGQKFAVSPSELSYRTMLADAVPLRKSLSKRDVGEFVSLKAQPSLEDLMANNCTRDVFFIKTQGEMQQAWALAYLDSFGLQPSLQPSGMMSGNMHWIGDFDQCRGIPLHREVAEDVGELSISPLYCRLELAPPNVTMNYEPMGTNPMGFSLGVCVSSKCTIDNLAPFVSIYISTLKVPMQLELQKHGSRCYDDNVPYSGVAIFTIILFSIIGVFLLIGLTTDLGLRVLAWWNTRGMDEQEIAVAPPMKHGALIKAALCFSPYTNFVKLFDIPSSRAPSNGPNFSAVNAIRTLSLFWVILGHMLGSFTQLLDNMSAAAAIQDRVSFTFVSSGTFAVDSFLFLSGFFAYWSLSKQLAKSPFWRTLPWIYFHRYVRLTPPLLAIILIDIGLWAHLSTGPLYFHGSDPWCNANWWTNLLYINNFVDPQHICIPWSWYLSVDMQLFIFTPFLVYLFVKKPVLGWLGVVGALALQFVVSTSLVFAYNLSSTIPGVQTNATLETPRNSADYPIMVYWKPYCRLGPYVVGLAAAYLLMNHSKSLKMTVFKNIFVAPIGWLVMFAILLSVTYSQYEPLRGKYVTHLFVEALFVSFARTSYGVAVGWLVLSCAFNAAGPIGGVLSWPFWAIPARLSYSGYLVHMLCLVFYVQTLRRPLHLTDLNIAFYYFGSIVMVLSVAVLFTLAFEAPLIGLLGMLRSGGGSGGRAKPPVDEQPKRNAETTSPL